MCLLPLVAEDTPGKACPSSPSPLPPKPFQLASGPRQPLQTPMASLQSSSLAACCPPLGSSDTTLPLCVTTPSPWVGPHRARAQVWDLFSSPLNVYSLWDLIGAVALDSPNSSLTNLPTSSTAPPGCGTGHMSPDDCPLACSNAGLCHLRTQHHCSPKNSGISLTPHPADSPFKIYPESSHLSPVGHRCQGLPQPPVPPGGLRGLLMSPPASTLAPYCLSARRQLQSSF